jgi:hypothetical protein
VPTTVLGLRTGCGPLRRVTALIPGDPLVQSLPLVGGEIAERTGVREAIRRGAQRDEARYTHGRSVSRLLIWVGSMDGEQL